MANHKQAEKRNRQRIRRTAVNRSRKTRIRSAVKRVELAVAAGDQAAALSALQAAQPELDRGVGKGVLHRSTASRKLSRLTARVRSLGASS
ncbi:MAG: 30S ribosomal protein S20 [Sneathiellaceae bacterium]